MRTFERPEKTFSFSRRTFNYLKEDTCILLITMFSFSRRTFYYLWFRQKVKWIEDLNHALHNWEPLDLICCTAVFKLLVIIDYCMLHRRLHRRRLLQQRDICWEQECLCIARRQTHHAWTLHACTVVKKMNIWFNIRFWLVVLLVHGCIEHFKLYNPRRFDVDAIHVECRVL